jgi:hypothetical protein
VQRDNKLVLTIALYSLKIKIERSGGFGGITSSSEMNVDKLTPVLEGTVRKLLDNKGSGMLKGTRPKGAADYLNYKITLEEGPQNSVIECNQFDMNDDLKSLISYVESRSRKER